MKSENQQCGDYHTTLRPTTTNRRTLTIHALKGIFVFVKYSICMTVFDLPKTRLSELR